MLGTPSPPSAAPPVTDPPVALAPLTDAELMRRVQNHDERAFEAIYDRYSSRALRLAQAVCRNSDRAQDAVQEGFLSVWRSRASYARAKGDVGAWTMGIVRNRAIDIARYSGVRDRHRGLGAGVEDFGEAPLCVEEEAVARDEGRELRALLGKLPDPQREAITLAYWAGLSHGEIAALLELPAGTVKGRMRLGLQKLRHEMASSAPSA